MGGWLGYTEYFVLSFSPVSSLQSSIFSPLDFLVNRVRWNYKMIASSSTWLHASHSTVDDVQCSRIYKRCETRMWNFGAETWTWTAERCIALQCNKRSIKFPHTQTHKDIGQDEDEDEDEDQPKTRPCRPCPLRRVYSQGKVILLCSLFWTCTMYHVPHEIAVRVVHGVQSRYICTMYTLSTEHWTGYIVLTVV